MSLWSNFIAHNGRKVLKWKHYFPAYEKHFSRFVDRDLVFFEIGLGTGGSIQLWKQYFGSHARIVGIDIDPKCAAFAEDQIDIRIGSQDDPDFLRRVVEEFGVPDIVLDDGSHMMSHIHATFSALYPLMRPNSVYAVEDLHTAYFEEYEGGLRRPGTFIETCKNLIDELNADFSRGALPPTDFTRSTLSMHFYDSMVIFEKGRHTKKTFNPRE